MKFELPPLPYAKNALEPHISEKTMEFHYGKHHQTYVDNLNKMIVGTPFENAALEEIIEKAEGPLYNNAAQVWNHTFFWNCMMPKGQGAPVGELADAINEDFGSFDEFKQKFTAASLGLFGSGWTFLVQNEDGKLEITQEGNAGTPLRKNQNPILTLDVWEHAYYLDRQNRRAEFVEAFWNLIDWEAADQRFE